MDTRTNKKQPFNFTKYEQFNRSCMNIFFEKEEKKKGYQYFNGHEGGYKQNILEDN